MIALLSGKVREVRPEGIVLEAGGVGYRVAVPIRILDRFREGSRAEVWTYHHLREDASLLFGFVDRSDERLFARLLSVNGVGPKVALTLLNLGSAAEIEGLIEAADVGRLTSMPGVGKKTAERIVLELGGQLTREQGSSEGGELEGALVGLGYKASEAQKALGEVDQSLPESERLKEALRRLAK